MEIINYHDLRLYICINRGNYLFARYSVFIIIFYNAYTLLSV